MLSTPVWGVAIRNDADAAFDAPPRCIATAVGSTPHEHNGSGTPTRAPLRTDLKPLPDRWRLMVVSGTKACNMPAIRNPSSMYGDIPLSKLSNV